jgi:hypothetical protein
MTSAVLLLALALAGAPLDDAALGAELHSRTVAAWDAFVRATEARIARETADGRRFLGLDFEPAGDAAADRSALRGGAVVIDEPTTNGAAAAVDVPDGEVHHWRGALFLAGVTLDEVLQELRRPAPVSDDVLASRVLHDAPEGQRVYLKLLRKKLVTAVYNTEHDVRFVRHSATRASTHSVAARIAELEAPGTPQEKEKPVGRDRGFLWRLNAYSRFEQVAGGVIVEIESISLSRGVPLLVRPIVGPIVASVARESMERTLESLRRRLPAGGRGSR